MSPLEIILLSVGGFVLISLVAGFFVMRRMTLPIAKNVFRTMFVRDSKDKWQRECSAPDNPEHLAMFNEGVKWQSTHADKKTDVQIKSADGLNLFGEFYDLGFDRCAIILAGRAETLVYGYYFGDLYERAGFNLLFIDQRATGESEGDGIRYGVLEAEDCKKWIELLKGRYSQKRIVVHGICTGATTAIYLSAQGVIDACALEGPYKSFREVLIRRTKAGGHPTFPVVDEIVGIIKKETGVDIVKYAPKKYVGKMKTPVLFLCGRADYSSLPKNAQMLFDRCKSPKKEIVWFDVGAHSHLRIANRDDYDKSVCRFMADALK